jgi:hypothetical protein
MNVSQPVDVGSDFLGYRIEELIGRGGMGVVYRAYDLRLKRPVALKLVAPALARDERFRERFARESELVMSLEHPNVVPIYDAGDVDGRVYLAMRLVDGSDLGSLLRAEGALAPARAIAICAQIAAALDAAHARGLVHRDVKPSNVLLDSSDHVYLADFGLTRQLDEEAGSEDFAVGTPAYLAPEQVEGGAVDSRTDIYSLGCVLYECLTAEPVFVRASRLAVAWAHLEDEPPNASQRRAELPGGIDAVVARALAKDPEQRYGTCGALVAAAGNALGLSTRPIRRRGRNLLVAGVAALVVVAGAAAITASLVHGTTRRAAPPLLAGANTLVRINPHTRTVTKVVHGVGPDPAVAAGSGDRVWVYNEGDETLSEVDTRTNRVLKPIARSLVPAAECCDVYAGPMLAADASGAWLITGGALNKPQLVHVSVHGTEVKYPLGLTPTGVALGDGSVWIVGHTSRDDEVLRIDQADGRLLKSMRFAVSARINSIAFGRGWVWVVSSAKARLYRIDPNFRKSTRTVSVPGGPRGARPEVIADNVLTRVSADDGHTTWFDPSSLRDEGEEYDGAPNAEEQVWAFGVLWWYDSSAGSVQRENGPSAPVKTIPVTHPPGDNGACLSSITAAGGAVWVTVARLQGYGAFVCRG